MKINTKRKSQGFTIIEVMIVLAIAALILLIVLLAVPALQRNSRNTTLKNDAASVAGGISTFESDNNGLAPTSVTGTGTVTLKNGANSETISVNGTTQVQAGATDPNQAGVINVSFGKTCDGQSSTRAVALRYDTETSGGLTKQCLDS